MLRCYVVDPDTQISVEYTQYLRPDKNFELGSRAYDGQADQGTFTFDDPDGELDWLVELAAGRIMHFTEDSSGAALVIASGRITSKSVERGGFAADKGREFTITIEDRNADLRNIIVHNWERPRESGRDRVLALRNHYLAGVSSTALNPEGDRWGRDSTNIAVTYVPDSMNAWMSAHTYDETDPLAILRECAETEGKRFFVYTETDGDLALYYAPVTETAQLNSTVSVSTVIADVNGTTCFEPIWNAGPAFDSNGQETISGALMIHPDGSTTYERRDAPNIPTGALDIEERHDRREQSVHTQGHADDGTEELHAYLNFRDQEERRRQFSLDIPDDRIHLVKAGMRMEVKLAWAGLVPSSEFFRIGQTRIRWIGPSANEDNHYNVIVTLEYPVKLLRRWGSEDPGPQPAPTTPPVGGDTEIHRWSFTTDNEDDATSTYATAFKRSAGAGGYINAPFGTGGYGYFTNSSGNDADPIPATPGTNYVLACRMFMRNGPTSSCSIKIRWKNGGATISEQTVVDGADYAAQTIYDISVGATAPANTTHLVIFGTGVMNLAVDDLVLYTAGAPAGPADPYALPNPGTSPYYARSDDPRFTADDQHLITRLSRRMTNNSGVTLAEGDVVVPDLSLANAVTRTTTPEYSDAMVGVILEGGADDAEVVVLWWGTLSNVNVTGATVDVGDYLYTSTTAGAAAADPARAAGAVGRVISVDGTDPSVVLWWGLPDGSSASATDPDDVRDAGRWELIVTGSAPPVASTNEAEDDFIYGWVPG